MTAPCSIKEEARRQGKKRYFNGVPCKNGHVAERSVSTGGCVVCIRAKRVEYYYKHNQKDLVRKYARERRAANPVKERQRAVRVLLKGKYGLTEAQYLALFEKQQGRCGICRKPVVSRLDESRPIYSGRGAPKNEVARVDHCHVTGHVRGLLCSACNLLLGKAKDDEKILSGAVRYLRETRNRTLISGRRQHDTLQAREESRKRDLESRTSRGSRRDDLSPFPPT